MKITDDVVELTDADLEGIPAGKSLEKAAVRKKDDGTAWAAQSPAVMAPAPRAAGSGACADGTCKKK